MGVYSPTQLEGVTTGQTGWNLIFDSNMQRLNDYLAKFQNLWDTGSCADLDFLRFDSSSGKLRRKVVSVTADYTMLADDEIVLADAASGAISVTLPSAGDGKEVVVKKVDSSANAVTVVGTIDGVANLDLSNQWDFVRVVSSGGNWYKV